MLPFRVEIKPGTSLYKQVVYAAKKAVVTGQLQPGDRFPSVRDLAQQLRINPNTAHKVVTALIHEGLIQVNPGRGTVVSKGRRASRQERSSLLNQEVERLVVEAKRLSLQLEDVLDSIGTHWVELGSDRQAPGVHPGRVCEK